jgi:membrane associated rhomboid family serine protease
VFPYSDNLIGKRPPPGIVVLVALLCAINIPLFLDSEWQRVAVESFGFIPFDFATHPFLHIYTLVTSVALHGDVFHLAGNCLFLWVFGRSLEKLFGLPMLLGLFPALGVVGLLLHWVLYPDSHAPVIGASGAIAALMGAYLPLFPGARVRIIVFLGWFWKRFTLPAWAFLFYWGGLQLLSLALGSGAGDGVAYAVHAGSFMAGLMAAIIWKTSYPFAEEKLAQFTQTSFRT